MKQEPTTKKVKRAGNAGTKANSVQCEKHIPEWNAIFRKLRMEAQERYPDGRLCVLLPDGSTDEEGVTVEDREDDE